MWVKICGTTSARDAETALEAGADALGLILAPSPRQVSLAQAAAMTKALPGTVERYGVFVHPSFEFVVRAVEQAGLSGVQLHASSEPDLDRRLRTYFEAKPGFKLLRVVRLAPGEALSPAMLNKFRAGEHDGLLVDSRTAAAEGGTGTRFDWQSAQPAFATAGEQRLIVAGGLMPENVAEAITTLRPWGVDVVTGVEQSPGRKDTGKVKDFVWRAREAAASLAAQAMGFAGQGTAPKG